MSKPKKADCADCPCLDGFDKLTTSKLKECCGDKACVVVVCNPENCCKDGSCKK